ncbi:MAG: ATP-binding protein [Planctomycetes bacterium]|nr:ATP-binding protein [Planctomycetota bacterium]
MTKIEFEGDWSRQRQRGQALEELAEGRLPGPWGLLQQIVGHWAISHRDRGVLRYGKAGLDTIGSVLSYRAAKRKLLDDGSDPAKAWLAERNYVLAFPAVGDGFLNFMIKALNEVPFRKKKVRNEFGNSGESALIEFSIGGDACAYFYDSKGNPTDKEGAAATNPDKISILWDGPYVRAEDHDALEAFVRGLIWDLMGTQTLMLARSRSLTGSSGFTLGGVRDDFDFISADDAWNDVRQLAARSRAFLDKGRSRCVLFYGPPGTGKSTVARAIARELRTRVLLVDHEAVSQMSDHSVALIITLLKPGMLVLNDIDRSSDDHAGLLQSLDVAYQGNDPLLTVLTVNDISSLDPALLRPGRIHETRHVPEPSEASRRMILAYYVRKLGLTLSPADVEAFVSKSEGFSPADVKEFCETAFAMGLGLALDELSRIKTQRLLYAGTRCEEFNKEHRNGRNTGDDDDD